MLIRQAWQRALCTPVSLTTVPRARWQNYVWSEAMCQLEKDCETCCPFPRFPEQKVTVVGAASDVGRIACLCLKQQSVVKILAMYDEYPRTELLGIATDIAHIDSNTAVHMFQGSRFLRHALYNADVVVICGGEYPKPYYCNICDYQLFYHNMHYVRSICLAIAKFCPHAVVAIQTPPVDCNFTLCKHTLAMTNCYDKRRVLGLNSINCMRANQLYATLLKADPTNSSVPVICGTGRCTRVPVFSSTKYYYCLSPGKMGDMTRIVREMDELICKVKYDSAQGDLSIGFATAKAATSIMRGLFEKPTLIDSALVEQGDPKSCYDMEICSTPVVVGKEGVMAYKVPKVSDTEHELLTDSKIELEDSLNLGRCYATGDRYFIHPGKVIIPPPRVCTPCIVCNQEDALSAEKS